jgi:hypothetical protein
MSLPHDPSEVYVHKTKKRYACLQLPPTLLSRLLLAL